MVQMLLSILQGFLGEVLPTLPYILAILAFVLLTNAERTITKNNKKLQQMQEGMICVLRQQMINDYNKYSERGEMPLYAKRTFEDCYECYKALGGNGYMREVHEKAMDLPERRKDEG